MLTYTALTTLSDPTNIEKRAEALAEALEMLTPEPTGVGVFEMEDGSGMWEVGGYFIEPPDLAGLDLLAAMHGANPFVVSEVPDQDWVAKVRRELTPVAAGRFYVYGSHDAHTVPDNVEPLLIEAAMAFGTGHHGTTLGCLRALDRLAHDGFVGKAVADIGCGTAVLAMAAARIWPDEVLASDIDEVAVDVARANVAANDLTGRVRCIESKGFDHPDLASASFDLIFANILKGPLIDLAPELSARLIPGGNVILSGILVEQADEVAEVYFQNGNSLLQREDIGDWTTLMLRKSV